MPEPIKCLRCQTAMEPGYIADNTHGGNLQEAWSAGEPKASFWTGLKVDRKHAIPVVTLRCPSCGMLESYAHPAA